MTFYICRVCYGVLRVTYLVNNICLHIYSTAGNQCFAHFLIYHRPSLSWRWLRPPVRWFGRVHSPWDGYISRTATWSLLSFSLPIFTFRYEHFCKCILIQHRILPHVLAKGGIGDCCLLSAITEHVTVWAEKSFPTWFLVELRIPDWCDICSLPKIDKLKTENYKYFLCVLIHSQDVSL